MKTDIQVKFFRPFCFFRRMGIFLVPAVFLLFNALPGITSGQSGQVDPEKRVRLILLSDSLARDYQQANALARVIAAERGLDIRFVTQEGVRYELQRFENDLPFYYRTFNAGAAVTSGAGQLHPLGAKRLMLSGKGLTIGMWDAGSIFDHLEYTGRFVNRNPATQVDDHATHVAGTLIATGINETARGMAFESRLHTYDWNSDISEMATEAAAGMLVSNHSYGTPLGWEWRDGSWRWMGAASADEDYRFGFYSNVSRAIDQVAFNAPWYLSVWAAGNDRNDAGDGSRPPDGPYDTMGPEGVSKNVLTIGAVNGIPGGYTRPSDVVMTDFSSWGPTDDGRVKPDLVTKGRAVFSTNLNNGYRSTSGTSMSSPVAAGSLALVQQLYNEITHGQYLRAASLKGLAIHTANQAGNGPGPDYSFGWGLLDVAKMADFLTRLDSERLYFSESTLANQQQYVVDFTYNGEGPIVATLSWTDVPGTPVAPQLNPTNLMLVNDLDMRIVHEGGDVYRPWILDPANPAAPATTGDNFRDNVEKIRIGNPPAGNYQLTITHKGSLEGGKQDFSLFLQNGDVPVRKDVYWIGRTGNWSDPAKWSFSSGGAPANAIPGPGDNVVLDQHSFTDEGQVLVLDTPGSCYSLVVSSGSLGRIDFARRQLNISGSLLAERTFAVPETGGTLVFSGPHANSYVLKKNTIEFPSDLVLIFDNPGGRWRFLSDFSADRIVLRSGMLVMEDIELGLRELVVERNEDHKSIWLGKSVISGLHRLDFPDQHFQFSGDQGKLVFGLEGAGQMPDAVFRTGGVKIALLENHASLQVFGSVMTASLVNAGPLWFNRTVDAKHVLFSETAGFEADEDGMLVVRESFTGSGEAGRLVPFLGYGRSSGISGPENRLFCLDFVEVDGLPALGAAVFNAGPNSIVRSAAGWQNVDCDDVLFADFKVTSPCRYSWTFFDDLSSGEIVEWDWRFGNLGSSDLQSPVFTFQQTGNQTISLTVSDNANSHRTEKQLQIINNPLPDPQVFSSGTSYFVDVYNVNYQWYRNGRPIEGANAQSYNNEGGQPGVYQVLISNENCNRPSKNQITVSSAGPELPEDRLVVYPNPATHMLYVRLDGIMDRIELSDMLGRILVVREGGQNFLELNVSGIMPGAYFLRVWTGSTVLHRKIQVL